MSGRALLGAVLALGIWPAAATAQQPPEAPAKSLPVQTVPKIEGARFVLNGRTFKTDANGRVTVPGDGRVGLRDRVRIPETTIAPDMRVEFSRRKEGAYLFNRLARVRLSFVDLQGRPVAPNRVERVVLKGIHGDRVSLKPGRTMWLQSARIVPFKEGFEEKRLSWVVEKVLVDGQNVVNRNQQGFEPFSTPDFQITLLFYPARVTVRDSFFGFPTGSRVIIKHPNGKVQRYRLGPDGEVAIPSLPRGEYTVSVEGPGLSFEHPLQLSRRQVVDLELLSYLDLAVGIGLVGSIAIGLLALGGRLPRPSEVVRLVPRLKAHASELHPRLKALPVELRARLLLRERRFATAGRARARVAPPRGDPSDQCAQQPFGGNNGLGDDRWSCELHLDVGHVATILRQGGGACIGWAGEPAKPLGARSIIEALKARRTLIVCPNTAKETVWARELPRLLPAHDVKVLPDASSKRDAMLADVRAEPDSPPPMVLVVQYEALVAIAGLLGEWDLVVADEAHRMRNTRTLMSRALKRVPSKHRLALSGPIVQNHPEELHSVMQWLFPEVPDVLHEAVVCRAKWRGSDTGYNQLAVGVVSAQLETLRRDPETFDVYRRKTDVQGLPPATEQAPAVDLSGAPRNGDGELQWACGT